MQDSGLALSRLKNRLTYAANILGAYSGEEPFQNHLKTTFKENKQFGSKDRKFYKAACYSYFRLGPQVKDHAIDKAILVGLYLTTEGFQFKGFELLFQERLGLDPDEKKSIEEKISQLGDAKIKMRLDYIFPFQSALSEQINHLAYAQSILRKRPIWLRFFGNRDKTLSIFAKRNISVSESFGFFFTSDGQPLNQVKADFEIQDVGSQLIVDTIVRKDPSFYQNKVWDCCTGAGGKALQIMQAESSTQLYISDIRYSALKEAISRFEKHKSQLPFYAIANLMEEKEAIHFAKDNENQLIAPPFFDTILVDAPCSGSGTWARTPEQLSYFKEKQLKEYQSLQKNIVQHALPFLNQGGVLYYATCSVFATENEQQKEAFSSLGLELVWDEYIKGYKMNGDNFYLAKYQLFNP